MPVDTSWATVSLQIADFYRTNQAALNNNMLLVASGSRLNSPSDDSNDVVDTSGLTLGVSDEATESAALNTQIDRATSYLSKTSVYTDTLTAYSSLANQQTQTLQQAISNERDADTGAAYAQLTQQEVSRQMEVSMLAQANLDREGVLSLLQNI